MNWRFFKFLLFVTAAISGTKADHDPACPSINQQGCPNGASTNFYFQDGYTGHWYWLYGTIPGASIFDTGLITFNLPGTKFAINGVCIQWKDWTYTYVTRPSGQSCNLEPFTKSISNVWGY
jgi:hypothetical protein